MRFSLKKSKSQTRCFSFLWAPFYEANVVSKTSQWNQKIDLPQFFTLKMKTTNKVFLIFMVSILWSQRCFQNEPMKSENRLATVLPKHYFHERKTGSELIQVQVNQFLSEFYWVSLHKNETINKGPREGEGITARKWALGVIRKNTPTRQLLLLGFRPPDHWLAAAARSS